MKSTALVTRIGFVVTPPIESVVACKIGGEEFTKLDRAVKIQGDNPAANLPSPPTRAGVSLQ